MNINFCQNIKTARISKELTQKQVAEILHIAEYRYANWEQGRAEPCLDDLDQLCEVLEVSADYLLGRVNEHGERIIKTYNVSGQMPEILKQDNKSHIKSTPDFWTGGQAANKKNPPNK